MDLRHALLRALASLALASPSAAGAFTVDDNFHEFTLVDGQVVVDAEATVLEAPRWSAVPVSGNRGLHDGVQVAIAPGFAERLGAATPAEVAAVREAALAAFSAWETPELRFDVTFDGPAVEGTFAGAEVDIFVVDGNHPFFEGRFNAAGAVFDSDFRFDRVLTNGELSPGWAFTGSDIFLAAERVLGQFGLLVAGGFAEEGDQLDYLQYLLMHELGHNIGFDHPNEFSFANFDTDLDPFTPIDVDPLDPLAGLMLSPVIDDGAIMANFDLLDPNWESLLFTELRPDDRSGLAVLYPTVPEPSTALLAAAGLAALAARRRAGRATRATRPSTSAPNRAR